MKIQLVVQQIRDEASGIKSFVLTSADGNYLPSVAPGAHMTFTVELPDGSTDERQYSLVSDSSQNDHYTIAVRREDNGRGGSAWFHDHVSTGDILIASGPVNDFPLAHEDVPHSVLIAGGIGITPILSMVRHLVARERSVDVHYASRTEDTMAFQVDLAELVPGHVHLYHTDGNGGKRPDIESIVKHAPDHSHVYVCGPSGMIRDTVQTSRRLGWNESRVHYESFGGHNSEEDQPLTVELARSEMTIMVPAQQTILDAMLDAGVWASYDCKRGECSMCLVPVLDGTPDHRDVCLSDEDQTRYMCPCVSRSKSDRLVIDL